MLDLAARNAAPAKRRFTQAKAALPALNGPALVESILPASELPAESSPRLESPAGVPLTDMARFRAHAAL